MNIACYYDFACEEYIRHDLSSYYYFKDEIIAFFENILPGSIVADIGCGPGIEAKTISETKKINFIGIDFSKRMIDAYKQNVDNSKTIVADMRRLPLSANEVDGVYSSFSLIHLDDQEGEKAIQEFARVIKPGGRLFLATGIGSGDKRYYTHRLVNHKKTEAIMFFFWIPERLLAVLDRYNFSVEKQTIDSIVSDEPDSIYLTCILNGCDTSSNEKIVALGTSWRHNSLDHSLNLSASLKKHAGISRIARIDRLCGLDIPVFSIVRPESKISITVAGGKGTCEKESRVSGIFEAYEIACAETDINGYKATSRQLKTKGIPFVEIETLGASDNGEPFIWLPVREIESSQPTLVPSAYISLLPHSNPVRPCSNGLASGTSLYESLFHGFLEVIERHTYSWALLKRDAISVDLDASDIPFYRQIKPQLEHLNLVLEVKDISKAVDIPSYYAIIFNPCEYDSHLRGGGLGCHLDPHIAINRAITEAIQARAVAVSGAREDINETKRLKGKDFSQQYHLFKYWYEPTNHKTIVSTHRPLPNNNFRSAIAEVKNRVTAADKHIGRFLFFTYRSPIEDVWVTRAIIEGAELFSLDRHRRCPAIATFLKKYNL